MDSATPAPAGEPVAAAAGRGLRFRRWLGANPDALEPRRRYHLARFLILRLLGLVYLTGFLILIHQGLPLLGSHGLTPIDAFVERIAGQLGSKTAAFERLPSLFWLSYSDALFQTLAWAGAVLSALVLLGVTNAGVMTALWALYMSFVHVGQDWYGYGWEIQLLETGFLAIFLCPLGGFRPFPAQRPAPVVLWLFRWLIFRIMVGAGLIKIRGDSCWRDLTCLDYHYETQPNPNPLSRTLHAAPHWVNAGGVLFNHLVELGLPWLMLLGRNATRIAGVGFVAFQATLIVSGNLSFLNWLTIVPALACFDDAFLGRLLPSAFARWAKDAECLAAERAMAPRLLPRATTLVPVALAVLIAWLSIPVVTNLLSGNQLMNTSFGAFDLVNTYGAFGSVGRARREIVFEGTSDTAPTEATQWKEYPFHCAPCDPNRRPCVITPYHYRLDWQIWFAAMSRADRYPWTLHLTWKLLHNDPGALSLLAANPFPDAPPRFIRARYYQYEFAAPLSGRWWDRKVLGNWIQPLSTDDPRLLEFLRAYGWIDADAILPPSRKR